MLKKIAIIGAGFAGLATAWHLLNQKNIHISLFDEKGIGGGASGIAAGMLHPYIGVRAKLTQHGIEGMKETKELLNLSSKTLNQQVFQLKGMLRLALTKNQEDDFKTCAAQFNDVTWLEKEDCEAQLLQPCLYPGILIHSALVVDCPLYLKGLFLACKKKGMTFIQKRVDLLAELDDYNQIIVTTGAKLPKELSSLPVHQVKGQVLKVKWPTNKPKPLIPINSSTYLIPEQDLLGATFEHHFASVAPDITFAKNELLPKTQKIFPDLKDVIECRSALRATTPQRKPLIKQVSEKCWVYTGLAAKGLLYHSLFAKKLIAEMEKSI